MDTYKNLPIHVFQSVAEWRAWLDENHATAAGIWLKFAKKGSGVVTVTYVQARDTAIAYGWIDGLINKLDEEYYVTRFTARKAKSMWSKVNCAVAEALIASGAMHPSGLAHVDAAKRDGRWERAYDPASTIAVPECFQKALDRCPVAAERFRGLTSSNRYAFLYRLQTAASQEKRDALIERFIEMLDEGKVFHPDA